MALRFTLRNIFHLLLIFLFGAVCYSLLEILWRGFTHWSMAVTGGVCLCSVYGVEQHLHHLALRYKAVIGCMIITTAEFAVGCVVNLVLRWNVWDYSDRFGNLLGQVCPLFCVVWYLLCLAAFPLCSLFIRFWTADKTPPQPST